MKQNSTAAKKAASPAAKKPAGERLQKILAQAGIASRRKAEEIILEGRVQVNGTVITELGTRADAETDHIRVDGKLLHGKEQQKYYMLNKPRGYVTTLDDPQHRPTVMQLMQQTSGPHSSQVRLYPVGRLDYLSEGLLLMTNDGALANSLSKAAAGVEKTYLVKTSGMPPAEGLEQIRRGIMIDRGRLDEVRAGRRDRILTAPAKVELVRGGDNPWYEVTLTEGRNRQLRKMFEEIGHHVEKSGASATAPSASTSPPASSASSASAKSWPSIAPPRAARSNPRRVLPEFAKLKSPAKGTKPRRPPTRSTH